MGQAGTVAAPSFVIDFHGIAIIQRGLSSLPSEPLASFLSPFGTAEGHEQATITINFSAQPVTEGVRLPTGLCRPVFFFGRVQGYRWDRSFVLSDGASQLTHRPRRFRRPSHGCPMAPSIPSV